MRGREGSGRATAAFCLRRGGAAGAGPGPLLCASALRAVAGGSALSLAAAREEAALAKWWGKRALGEVLAAAG